MKPGEIRLTVYETVRSSLLETVTDSASRRQSRRQPHREAKAVDGEAANWQPSRASTRRAICDVLGDFKVFIGTITIYCNNNKLVLLFDGGGGNISTVRDKGPSAPLRE